MQRKSDKALYAMKYINKRKCIDQKAVTNTIFERNLLETVHHPLIVNLRYAFQDDENMFMVLDLMLGGDLKYHVDHLGGFDERCVRQYAAEIAAGLMFLHDEGVVHRDVKPENVLLDAEGHAHLTDFNVAAFLPSGEKQLKSIAGTLSYMAPEVITKRGYREGPDWWSLGVTLFELMYGKRPFRGHSGKELCLKIIDGRFDFPENSRRVFSTDCCDFINGLLQKDPDYRLGVGDLGRQRLKQHPFLKGIDWKAVESKQLRPLFQPRKQGNFNPMHEAEDILLEDKPLNPNRRKSTMPVSDPDLNRIQDEFEDYNWKMDKDAVARKVQAEKLREESAKIEARLERSSIKVDEEAKAANKTPVPKTIEEEERELEERRKKRRSSMRM